MAEFVEYEIWLGTFEGEDFVWKVIKKFNDFDKAYAFYHDYIMKQATYDDDELKKVWSSGRIDVELRQGKKLLNWAGLFSRKVADPSFDPYKGSKGKKAEPEEAQGSDSLEKGEAPLQGAKGIEYVASLGHAKGSTYDMEKEMSFQSLAPARKAYRRFVEECKASGDPELAASLDVFENGEHVKEILSHNIWER